MTQMKHRAGGPRRMLDDASYDKWRRANMDAFDRLPDDVRMAIRETGVDIDCMIVEAALTKPDVSVADVVAAIFARAGSVADSAGSPLGLVDHAGRPLRRTLN